MSKIKNKKLFLTLYWVLSFTWALPTTLLGGLVALGLLITGHKPKRYCCALCFPLGSDWGLELGLFFIGSKDEDEELKQHEFGHHLQACFLLGPLTLFVATIPSIIRFWIFSIPKPKYKWLFYVVFVLIALSMFGCLMLTGIVYDYTAWLGWALTGVFCVFFSWIVAETEHLMLHNDVKYEDFWVEADATRRGKEISEKFFKTT